MNTIELKRMNVHISKSVMNIIENYKQFKKNDNEAGGILFGQIMENNVYIMKASTPNKFDKASRYSFVCNKDAAQIIIDFEFKNSGGKTIYFGEWHTHPENKPTPSSIDINMIKSQFFKNKINEPFLFLLIQGITDVYFVLFDGKELKPIDLHIFDEVSMIV